MLAKQLKTTLLPVFSQLTQRSGFRQNSCAVDEQACVFGSCAFNKHSVLKIFMTDGLNFQTVTYKHITLQDQALNQIVLYDCEHTCS